MSDATEGKGKPGRKPQKTAVWVVDMRKVAHAMIDAPAMQRFTLGDRLKLATLAAVSKVSYPTLQRAGKGRAVERAVVDRLASALELRVADFAYETDKNGNPMLPGLNTPVAPPAPAPPADTQEAGSMNPTAGTSAPATSSGDVAGAAAADTTVDRAAA